MSVDHCGAGLPRQRSLDLAHRGAGLLDRVYGKHDFPSTVMFVLTEKCNLSCGHCFVLPTEKENRLSLSQFVAIFDELADSGTLFATFTGGEPMLRDDIVDIIGAAVDRRFATKLKTNATLIDESIARALRQAGLFGLDTSLYAANAALHDRFVGLVGAFERSLGAARAFVRLGGTVTISSVVMNWNAEQTEPLIELCEEEGFYYSFDTSLHCRSDGDRAPFEFEPSVEQSIRVLSNPKLIAKLAEPAEVRAVDSPLCAAGRDGMCIMPDGTMRLCQSLPYELGNATWGDIKHTWAESFIRRWFMGLQWGEMKDCKDCAISGYCQRCPATALLSQGDVGAMNERDCAFAKAMERASQALAEEGESS